MKGRVTISFEVEIAETYDEDNKPATWLEALKLDCEEGLEVSWFGGVPMYDLDLKAPETAFEEEQ